MSDGFIANAIDDGDSIYCAYNTAGGLKTSINDGDLTDCADITISDNEVDGLISNAIDAGD